MKNKMRYLAFLLLLSGACCVSGCGKKKEVPAETEVVTEAETEKVQKVTELAQEEVTVLETEVTVEEEYKQKMANNYRHMSMEQLDGMMQQVQDNVIIDLRTAEEYAAGHIPGAINMPLDTLNEETMGELNPDYAVFVYADSSQNSRTGASLLCGAGLPGVMECGAFSDWQNETEK